MSRPYRILVTGSREWSQRDVMGYNILALVQQVDRDDPDREVIIVHGAAKGADLMAADIGTAIKGVTIEPHPADWTTHGKRAGPIRNQAMVDLGADICLAFPTASSVGTWDCVRRANRAGIRVIVVPERKP